MFIVNKKFSRAWEPVMEAATGDTFAVQPLLRDIEYIVLDRQPTEDERGGIVPAFVMGENHPPLPAARARFSSMVMWGALPRMGSWNSRPIWRLRLWAGR